MMIIKLTLCLQFFTTLNKNPGQKAVSELWPVIRPDPDPNCWPGDPLTRDSETRFHLWVIWSKTKKSVLVLYAVVLVLVLVLQVWCVQHGLVTLVVIMILKDTSTFQVAFIVSLFCAWNMTTMEINSDVYLLKS